MQLHTKPDSHEEPPNSDTYKTAKAACSYVEACGVFSIRVVQTILLIALYELKHAIFPAAYLTVGHCARLGHAMGLHDRKKAPQMLAAPSKSASFALFAGSDCGSDVYGMGGTAQGLVGGDDA